MPLFLYQDEFVYALVRCGHWFDGLIGVDVGDDHVNGTACAGRFERSKEFFARRCGVRDCAAGTDKTCEVKGR